MARVSTAEQAKRKMILTKIATHMTNILNINEIT